MSAAAYVNNSPPLLNVSLADKPLYETCVHMPHMILFYLCLQFTNTFMGIPANLMVLWLIRHNRKDSSSSDIFIVHLAVLDTFFSLSPPLELASLMWLNSSSTWSVLRFFYGIKDTTPLFLSCICLDRYMAVLHPIVFSNLKDKPHRPVCAGVTWLITLVYSVLKSVGTIPDFDKVFIVMVLAAFAFMVFCNISILWALMISGPGRDDMHPVKKRAFKMVLIIQAIIVFNYLPLVALFPFKSYFSPDVFRCYINFIGFGCMNISSSIQPVLYLSKVMPKCPACCCTCCTTEQTEKVTTAIEPSTVYSTTG
ncbi:proteinase-activated receptor 2-like [Trichomycterus rosablanca]|uniref:proteinase-activated receptor 2-like n=1 Tax=Trichomycterus rosablanca TaxID=2290929 RepID=UPI002F3607C7